jgi:trans-2,3-dihydro-3-hydroxyanthranilate isomerase
MIEHRYRILNVFTRGDERLSGNPLCVFEDGRAFSGEEMQAIARQLNLSETTFILPATLPSATARVRIFTPSFEMPFAGHPTLGTAHVVRDLVAGGNELRLEMIAGLVDVSAEENQWKLKTARAPAWRKHPASRLELAEMVGLPESALGGQALWVDTGSEQLVVPLEDPRYVREAKPVAALLDRHAKSDKRGESMVYLWAWKSASQSAPGAAASIVARFFFVAGTSVLEDPATGSACANLGGWMIATEAKLPMRVEVAQGEEAKRPSVLRLEVGVDKLVFVSGQVVELGRGSFKL